MHCNSNVKYSSYNLYLSKTKNPKANKSSIPPETDVALLGLKKKLDYDYGKPLDKFKVIINFSFKVTFFIRFRGGKSQRLTLTQLVYTLTML